MKRRIIIVGGGAAGFFLAANLKAYNQDVLILEQSKQPLQKVSISGGGRCNLTHACFEPHELATSYPRGSKELLSVFMRFQPEDTIRWFENKGVALYTDDDGCVFPKSDSSLDVVNMLLREAERNSVEVRCGTTVKAITQTLEGFEVKTNKSAYRCDILVITTGSSRQMWKTLEDLGHRIAPPVPSLFSFVCRNQLLQGLAGTVFTKVEATIPSLKIKQSGILLITHQGLSGPVILHLSAFGARELHALNYSFTLRLNWISTRRDDAIDLLLEEKRRNPVKHLYSSNIKCVTMQFWKNMLFYAQIEDCLWANVSKDVINKIADSLTNTCLDIYGRNTLKEEFVTAGGIDLKEVDFKTMQSKLIPNLYFAGETLNIDGITGGFNFQACWSEAYIISRALTTDSRFS